MKQIRLGYLLIGKVKTCGKLKQATTYIKGGADVSGSNLYSSYGKMYL